MPVDNWIRRRNAVETAKALLRDALVELKEAAELKDGATQDDLRRIAVARTNTETALLWAETVEE